MQVSTNDEGSGSSVSTPLEGITVVSIEQAVAASFATRQLADLGARVIKIERDSGDFARNYDTTVDGEASYFVWLNRGKESVVMDLKSEEHQHVLREMLARAGIFVENLVPGPVDLLVQCEAGLLSLTGTENHPAKVGVSIADISAGMYAYSGALAAPNPARSRGEGSRIEVSML